MNNLLINRIGIMQGRLSQPIDKKIQTFPKYSWKDEFKIANRLNFNSIEWIVDSDDNPIFDDEEINKILKLSKKYDIKINSLCADYFMENYLFKNSESNIEKNIKFLEKLIQQCQKSKIKILEIPFVDTSSLKTINDKKQIIKNLQKVKNIIKKYDVILGLETDLEPNSFLELLEELDHPNIRANYDVGNSASNDFDMSTELDILKKWIVNVHVKDRIRFGQTVPFGLGDVDFKKFFQKLSDINYKGDLIIQGAREDLVENTSIEKTCSKYLEFINRYLEKRIK